MTCGSCGAPHREGRKFCGQCGALVTVPCPSCGSVNEPSERFCGDCGSALGVSGGPIVVPPETGPPPATEVRQVSVLFCDLVGYTALSESRDAEDVRAVLSGYFDVARTVVARYGGVVEKFIGDAVMAVWGVPAAHEDDAERAVRAALDLVDAVALYGESVGLALQARAGLVTGRAASIANPLEGLVVGDRVNTAARVQSVAAPGTVLVDEVTQQATAAAIGYRDVGLHAVKGKAEPLKLWRAERVVAGVGGGRRIDGLEAPLVGRARELTVIKELFHACLEERRARLLAVTGQAGSGKSRLLWEFEKYVDGVAAEVLWHTGRCLAYGDGVAFWALAEMIRQRLGVAQEEAPDVVRDKLHVGLERWVLDPESRSFVEPRVGVLLGCSDTELPPQELFAGWRLLLERLTQAAPVVLVFEDMQWADPGLLDFLEQLLDWSAGHPLFVLVIARPELFDARPTLLTGRRNATSIGLDPLSDSGVEALLDGLVPGLPDDVKRLIAAHADGVPLYVVESVRSLIDRELVVAQDGAYRLVGEVDALRVPASLSSLLGARLDALSSAERTLVRDLCVLGGSFTRAAVEAVTELPLAAVEQTLAGLIRKDVLGVRRDPLSPDRGRYFFVQALLRTVAYDSLSKHERKGRHLRVAEHLRAAFPDDGEEVVELLAAHYRDAWAAAPGDPDADSIRRLAAATFERAGERAAAVGAPATAEQAYRLAAELTADEAMAAARLTAAAGMAARAARDVEALDLYDRLSAQHRRAGRLREARELVTPSSRVLIRLGRMSEAEARLREVLEDVATDDPASAAWVLGLARVAAFNGDPAGADALTDRALALAEAQGERALLAEAAHLRAVALVGVNRAAESLVMYRWAADLLGARGDSLEEMRLLINWGNTLFAGDQAGARDTLEGALEAARRIGDVRGRSIVVCLLAELELSTGHWADAERRLYAELEQIPPTLQGGARLLLAALVEKFAFCGDIDGARVNLARLTDWADSEDPMNRITYIGLAGLVAAATGDLESALEDCAASARIAIAKFGLRDDTVRAVWPVAVDAALQLGRLDEAASLLALVADVAPGFIPPFLQAQVRRLSSRLAAARGERDDVEEGLRAAVEQLAGLGYPYWRALAQADLAEWLRAEGRSVDGAPYLDEAVATLTGLGAEPALRQIGRRATTAP